MAMTTRLRASVSANGASCGKTASRSCRSEAQRLMRRLCEHCRRPVPAPPERLLAIGYTEEEATSNAQFYTAVGCPRCSGGYTGRFAILETLPMRDEIKRLVIEGRSAMDIKHAAVDAGMITLRRCALLNAMRGRTTIEEALRVTLDERRRAPAPVRVAVEGATDAEAEPAAAVQD